MMVPRTSLLVWTGFIAVPAAGWLVWAPGIMPAFLLLLWAGGATYDAWQSRLVLQDLHVTAPHTFRLARCREERMFMRLTCVTQWPCLIRLGLTPAPELGLRETVQSVDVASGQSDIRVEWRLIPRERGRYRIAQCHLETKSRWGFWSVRGVCPLDIGVFVYPGLLAQRHHVPALFMRRGLVGIRHQRRFGKGREFEQLRDYQSGDSLEDIHWKATAKRGYPVTKMYQVERTQEVYVAIDASRLSGRPVAAGETAAIPDGHDSRRPDPLIERYVNAALLLGRAAEIQGDRFGILTFSDRLLTFVRARRGQGHYRACLDAVCRLRTDAVTPDFSEVCTFIRQHLRRRSLIVLLTQLDDPALAETFLRDVEIIRRQHVVLVCMPVPSIVQPLFDHPEAVRKPADIYAALGGHLRWRQLRDVADALRKKGVGFLLTADDEMVVGLVAQYINIKQRQLL